MPLPFSEFHVSLLSALKVGMAILDSEIGTGNLVVVIPAVDVGPRHSGEHLPARVKVGLPLGGVEVAAEAVHWVPLGELGLGSGVILRVKFTDGGQALAKLLRDHLPASEETTGGRR